MLLAGLVVGTMPFVLAVTLGVPEAQARGYFVQHANTSPLKTFCHHWPHRFIIGFFWKSC